MSSTDASYVYQTKAGHEYVVSGGLLFPVGITPHGERYVMKDGVMRVLPNTRGPISNGLLFPAGPGNRTVMPAGQAGVPSGQWGGDAAGNPVPLDSNGNPVPLPPGAVSWTSQNGQPVALDANGNVVPSRPQQRTSALPPGVPSGTIVQSGGSISWAFIGVAVGAVVVVGAMAYYLTRTSPQPALRSARSRR